MLSLPSCRRLPCSVFALARARIVSVMFAIVPPGAATAGRGAPCRGQRGADM